MNTAPNYNTPRAQAGRAAEREVLKKLNIQNWEDVLSNAADEFDVDGKVVDNGIGRTEAWGVVTNHVAMDLEVDNGTGEVELEWSQLDWPDLEELGSYSTTKCISQSCGCDEDSPRHRCIDDFEVDVDVHFEIQSITLTAETHVIEYEFEGQKLKHFRLVCDVSATFAWTVEAR